MALDIPIFIFKKNIALTQDPSCRRDDALPEVLQTANGSAAPFYKLRKYKTCHSDAGGILCSL